MGALERLFGVLQQSNEAAPKQNKHTRLRGNPDAYITLHQFVTRNKPFFWAFWEDSARNLDVELASDENRLPGDVQTVVEEDLKTQVGGNLCVRHGISIDDVQTTGADKGLFWNPHTAALCLITRHVGGVGLIRNTTEAGRWDV